MIENINHPGKQPRVQIMPNAAFVLPIRYAVTVDDALGDFQILLVLVWIDETQGIRAGNDP